MKRTLSILLVTALLLSLVTVAAGAEAADWSQKYTLTVGVDKSPSHSFCLGLNKMNEILTETTQGAIQLDIYTDSVLGSESEMTESLIMGSLNMTVNGMLGSYEPLFNMLDCPYLFTSREQIRAFHDSDSFQTLCASLEANKNIKVLSYFEGGFRQVTNNVKPINTVADLAGMKIRTPKMEAMIQTFTALKCVVTPMSSNELYSALQQGVVDGQENPIANIYSNKFYEVQKYVSLTNHQYNSGYVYINKTLFDSMPQHYQAALLDAARQASLWQVQYCADSEADTLQKLKDAGMIVNEVDMSEFKAATASVYDYFYGIYGDQAKAMVEEIQALAK